MSSPRHPAECTTERLCLRAPRDADLAALLAIYGDPATQQHNPAGPLAGREAATHLLWRWQLHWARHGFGMWVVCRREAPEQVLGFGGLSWGEDGGERVLVLGVRLQRAAWGQGLASELGRAALQLALRQPGQPAVQARVLAANLAARRTVQRLGLVEVGQRRDFPWGEASLVYALDAAATLPASPAEAGCTTGQANPGRPPRSLPARNKQLA